MSDLQNFWNKLKQVPGKICNVLNNPDCASPCFCRNKDAQCTLCYYADQEFVCTPIFCCESNYCYSSDHYYKTFASPLICCFSNFCCVFPLCLRCKLERTRSKFRKNVPNYTQDYMKTQDYIDFMNSSEMKGYFEYKTEQNYHCYFYIPVIEKETFVCTLKGHQPPPRQRFEDFKKLQIQNSLLEHAGNDQDVNVLKIITNYTDE